MINIIYSTIQNEICIPNKEEKIEYDMSNTFFSELNIKEALEISCDLPYGDVSFTPCIMCGENAVGRGYLIDISQFNHLT